MEHVCVRTRTMYYLELELMWIFISGSDLIPTLAAALLQLAIIYIVR